jgi:hypothetical protein
VNRRRQQRGLVILFTWSRGRAAGLGAAVVAAALGFAHPAHADTPTTPDPSTVATVTAPDPSDLVDAAAAAAQGGATNVSVSVRIGSPGDDGNVSQTITVSTGAQGAQNSGAQAQSTQTAATNVAISVRIDSPGSNGTVTQTTSTSSNTAASTATQYQQPATQYPSSPAHAPPAPGPDAAPTAPKPDPSPAPAPAPAQAVTPAPSSWVWNLTVSGCGDTSSSDIAKAIDTGIQGWIWNWNIGTTCQQQSSIASNNPPESSGDISPESLPAPDPPTPPTITPPEPPALPDVAPPVFAAAQPAVIVLPLLGRVALPVDLTPVGTEDPLAPPEMLDPVSPARSRHARRPHPAPATVARPAGVLAANVTLEPPAHALTTGVRQHRPSPRRTASHKTPPRVTLPLILDSSFAPAPAGASAGGAGSGAAGGAAAALSLWLLLQLPGFAYLRLPARQRRPRGRVDDKQTRPG